jgi:hypothetical protein
VVAEGGLRGPTQMPAQAPASGPAPAFPTPTPGAAPAFPTPAGHPSTAHQVSAPPVSGPPSGRPAGPPVSGPPAHPVSAQPVSAHPGYPVSTPPAHPGYPVSTPPAHPGYPVPTPPTPPAYPVSTPPAYPMSAPAGPFPGHHPAPPQPAAAAIRPLPVAPARPNHTALVVTGIALAVLLVIGAVVLVVNLIPGDEDPDNPGGTDNRKVAVDRELYESGGYSVTLTSIEVRAGKLFVNMRYENRASAAWNLSCPAKEVDLRSSWVTVAGKQVYPDDSWCVQTHPGEGVTIGVGGSVDSWARYPVVPERNVAFTLQWYDLPVVSNLSV